MFFSNPKILLLVFCSLCFLVFIVFRPSKGWWWSIQKNRKHDRKIVIEDLLKFLYHKENSGKKMEISDLGNYAELFDVKDKLIETKEDVNDFVTITNQQISLSKKGNEYALQIIRAHRLYEKYLSEKTGFHPREWHGKAEVMEHKLTLAEIQKLADELGNPRYDPHGDPIPTQYGNLVLPIGNSLDGAFVGFKGEIIHIEDEPFTIYQKILEKRIFVGSKFTILQKNNEHITIESEGLVFELDLIVAANITVAQNAKDEDVLNSVRLSTLKKGEQAKIVSIAKECRGINRMRLLDLGFVRGSTIHLELESPMHDPKAYMIKGTKIALRKEQADRILVVKKQENDE